MLWTIAIILVVLWFLGLVTSLGKFEDFKDKAKEKFDELKVRIDDRIEDLKD